MKSCGSCDRLDKLRNPSSCHQSDNYTTVNIDWSDTSYNSYVQDVVDAIKTYERCYDFIMIKFKAHAFRPSNSSNIEHESKTIIKAGYHGSGMQIPYNKVIDHMNHMIHGLIRQVRDGNMIEASGRSVWIIDVSDKV